MTNALGEFLSKTWEMVPRVWPFIVNHPWEQHVIYRFGVVRKLCTSTNGIRGTGLHWIWPGGLETVVSRETNSDRFVTPPQTFDKFTFSFVGECKIKRLDLFYQRVNDEPLPEVVKAVCSAASAADHEGMAPGTPQFLAFVAKTATARMRGWGVELSWLEYHSVSECNVLRLLVDRNEPATIIDAVG